MGYQSSSLDLKVKSRFLLVKRLGSCGGAATVNYALLIALVTAVGTPALGALQSYIAFPLYVTNGHLQESGYFTPGLDDQYALGPGNGTNGYGSIQNGGTGSGTGSLSVGGN